jgi:uncharacterized membrane protein
MNLKQLLKQPLSNVPLGVAIAALAVALIGFADAVYLTLKYFKGEIPPCTIAGCDVVLSSSYSAIAGVPVSLLGAVFYLVMLTGLFIYIDSRNLKILKWTVQVAILRAYCQYCLLSAATSTVLFILAIIVFSKYRAADTLTG